MGTSDHKTFCAFGAYAVNVTDPTSTVVRLLVDASEIGKELMSELLVSLDLRKRIGRANVAWEYAIFDTLGVHRDGTNKQLVQTFMRPDNEDGIDVLTLGPVFFGPHLGGVYIERSRFYQEIRPRMDPTHTRWPYDQLRPYQVMSSAMRQGAEILRYHGFHARIIQSNGAAKKLAVHSFSPEREVELEVDLSDRSQCDDPKLLAGAIADPDRPAPAGKEPRVLTADSGINEEGAVFLALKLAAAQSLKGPKEPPGGG